MTEREMRLLIAKRIKAYRKACGFNTPQGFAEAAGISVGTLYCWEGAVSAPNEEGRKKLSDAFNKFGDGSFPATPELFDLFAIANENSISLDPIKIGERLREVRLLISKKTKFSIRNWYTDVPLYLRKERGELLPSIDDLIRLYNMYKNGFGYTISILYILFGIGTPIREC